jgi:hypothetical protein
MMLVFAGMFHIYRHGRSMEKAPPPLPPKPAIQPKAPSALPQTSYPAYTSEPSLTKPLAPQQTQKAQTSVGSSKDAKSSQNLASSSSKTGSQGTISSARIDDIDKARDSSKSY